MAGLVLVFATLTAMHVLSTFAARHTADLSHTYDNATLPWPSEKKERFRFTLREKYDSPHYEANSFAVAEHGGTHVDAPRHFKAGGSSVSEIPLSKLIGYTVVVDVTEKAKANRDFQVTESDFRLHEKNHGVIPKESIILLLTGWHKFWPNATLYFGTASNNTSILHFPGLSAAGARWLLNERKLKAVGIDTASIDYGQSQDFPVHRMLMEQNIPVFENVANLDQVPAKGATVYALPMKIGQGTGAPLRIIATWDDNPKSSAYGLSGSIVLVLCSTLIALMHG